jgi:hypothetical protein
MILSRTSSNKSPLWERLNLYDALDAEHRRRRRAEKPPPRVDDLDTQLRKIHGVQSPEPVADLAYRLLSYLDSTPEPTDALLRILDKQRHRKGA